MNFVPTNYVIPYYNDDTNVVDYNPNSILGVLSKTSDLSKFYQLVKFTKMEETLDLSNRVTIFVPDNVAFSKNIGINLKDFLNVKNVIMSSMTKGIYNRDDLLKNITYKQYNTITGKPELITLPRIYPSYRPYNKIVIDKSNDMLTVNGKVNIVKESISTDNGIIHITDGILIPEVLI